MLLNKIVRACAVAVTGVALAGCGSSRVVEYAVTSGSENLLSLTKVTANPEQTAHSLGVDPSSSTIFIAMNEGGSRNIYKKENPLSPAMTQITSGTLYCGKPAFNPELNRVVFTYCTKLDEWTTSKNEIYMIDLKNVNALIPVTQTATINEYSPSFSPDGSIVVYQANGGYSAEIWVKNTKTNENMLLGKGMMPQLSPDGTKIVFARRKTSVPNSPISIWTMNIDGSNVQQITNNPNEQAWEPCWSPDGKKIVFSSVTNPKHPNRDLYMIDADGSNLIQLTTNESYEDNPQWSSDGYIYFISDRGSKAKDYQVWRFKANY